LGKKFLHEENKLMRSTVLAQAMLLAIILPCTAFAAEFRAGAGKSDIQTSPDMWPVDGFTSQHDPLAVRVLLMDDGSLRTAIVVIDQTSISDGAIARDKATLTKLADVPADNTIVVASHTFSAPHVNGGAPGGGNGGPGGGPGVVLGASGGRNSAPALSPGTIAFAKAIDAALEAAVTQAKNSLQPARVGFGVGASDVSVNRDVPTPQGWWLGGDPAGFSDKSLPVVRIDSIDGKPLAVLINEAVQSSIMDHSENANGSKPVTADIAGAATRFVEEQYGGGTVAIFLVGAAGDQAPIFQGNRYVLSKDGSTTRVDIHEAGFTLVDLIGERLGSETLQVSEGIKATATPTPTLQVWRRTLKVLSQVGSKGLPTGPVMSYEYQQGPEIDVPVVLMRIGDIALVGLQAELAASVGAQLKANSPFPHTIVVTMVDGGAKYMPDSKSYERFTYEARNSRYARGAAEMTASGVDDLLRQMQQSWASK
jgi:neutral ceramidase